MRSPLALLPIIVFATYMTSCKSSSTDTPASFCDTACLEDTLKFTGDHALAPYVYLTVKDCKVDTVIWSYKGMGVNRKSTFEYPDARINKNFIRCVFKDTGYAYIMFNDCVTGRGYQVKIPFSKTQNFKNNPNGINNLDPKFSIGDNLLAYTDRGNIYVEEIATGKKAMMTFGEKVEIDFNTLHDYIDTVNISNQRIWVRVKKKDKWEVMEKSITLE